LTMASKRGYSAPQSAVKNVTFYVSTKEGERWKLPTKAEIPLRTSYWPELDVTPDLQPTKAAYYQSIIGILRWIVELGRVDIRLKVSMMSSHLTLPQEGRLSQVLQIFSYLRKYHNSIMVSDPSDPVIDAVSFDRKDWTSSEFGHIDGDEELPPNMLTPCGQGFTMWAKVDVDHAPDTVTRRLRTGLFVYLNCAPVYWFSKKQTSVESSSFGSAFVAMKQCCKYLHGLRYKLRMMGILCDEPTYIEGDNKSDVLANTTIPDSTLKKKNQSIAYHFVRGGSKRWMSYYMHQHPW
jgi:hypothetical protein